MYMDTAAALCMTTMIHTRMYIQILCVYVCSVCDIHSQLFVAWPFMLLMRRMPCGCLSPAQEPVCPAGFDAYFLNTLAVITSLKVGQTDTCAR